VKVASRSSIGCLTALVVSYITILSYVNPLHRGADKYRVRINYRMILQNRIFTNTEQKYMMLLPFEKGMFAVS